MRRLRLSLLLLLLQPLQLLQVLHVLLVAVAALAPAAMRRGAALLLRRVAGGASSAAAGLLLLLLAKDVRWPGRADAEARKLFVSGQGVFVVHVAACPQHCCCRQKRMRANEKAPFPPPSLAHRRHARRARLPQQRRLHQAAASHNDGSLQQHDVGGLICLQ